MKLSRTVRFHPALFGLVPLVNVLFLVLFFHVLLSQFVIQQGIAVTLPLSSFTLAPRQNLRIVTLTSSEASGVYFQDAKLSFDEFAAKLSADHEKDRTLIVKGDRNTPYDLVVRVMTLGLQSGYSVVLATSKEPK